MRTANVFEAGRNSIMLFKVALCIDDVCVAPQIMEDSMFCLATETRRKVMPR